MFRIFETKTEEELLCYKYRELMHLSYKLTLTDKLKSDVLNDKAQNILKKLKKLKFHGLD